MDYGKDPYSSSDVAKFVENQSVRTNPFGENRVGERAYRRAERIAAAIILLTNHIPESEPLRADVRTKASELLPSVLALRDEMRSLNSEKIRTLKSLIRELISLCRLLAVSGFISFQNAGTVSEALDELSGFLAASQRSTLSESASFSREDFLDTRDHVQELPTPRRDHKMSDAVRESIGYIKDSKENIGSNGKNNTARQTDVDKGQKKTSPHTARAAAILEVLRVSGELGIRDIASSLPEYSEKMVQRELAQMVVRGRVTKTGSKRWSTYTIAS